METGTSGSSGATESGGSAGTGNAGATESGGAIGAAGASPATAQASTSESAAPNFAEIHAAAERGEEIPLEHYEKYEQWLSDGMPEQQTPTQETAPQEQASEAGKGGEAWQAEAMAKVGAKTPEELPAKITELRNAYSRAAQAAKRVSDTEAFLDRTEEIFQGLRRRDPQALADFKDVVGIDLSAGSTAAGGNPQTETDGFLLPDDVINASLDPDLGRAFNDRLKLMRSDYGEKLRGMEGRLAGLDEYKADLQERKTSAERAKWHSRNVEEMLAVAEKYQDDYGLQGKPIRTLIERYMSDPGNPPPELEKLHAMAKLFATGRANSFEDAHYIYAYGGMNAKLAEARMGAAKPQQRTPSAGIAALGAGGGQAVSAANLSDEQAEAMASGAVPIPDEWLDEDGIPVKGRTPENLYARLTNAA
jgi:hypothetical protein